MIKAIQEKHAQAVMRQALRQSDTLAYFALCVATGHSKCFTLVHFAF